MADGKISSSAARSYTRKSKSKSDSCTGVLKKLLVVFLVAFCAWAYKAIQPPPPIKLEPSQITTPWITLRDGRHLSYIEAGVPKDKAKFKVIFVHGLGCSKYQNPFTISASPGLLEELGVYVVSIDRPGYGESDPDPNRTVKSSALDIEEVGDQLKLGSRFYVAGYSMGGQVMWSVLKYIPHRLAGAILLAPAMNYWWPNLPADLNNEAFSQLLPEDQWALRVAHYLPWLTYWWNTRTWLPAYSAFVQNPAIFSPPDVEALKEMYTYVDEDTARRMQTEPRQQGEFESIHRDLNIGSGKWEFAPMDVENPLPKNNGSVHLWMGDNNDWIVPWTLEHYFAEKLEWIKYHEVAGGGHLMAFHREVADAILKASF